METDQGGLQTLFYCAPMLTYLMYAPLRCSQNTVFATP